MSATLTIRNVSWYQIELYGPSRTTKVLLPGRSWSTPEVGFAETMWANASTRQEIVAGRITLSIDYDDGKGHPWEPPPAKPMTISRICLLMEDP